jgi:uncharacterized repeat protein (TIGR01451 family)
MAHRNPDDPRARGKWKDDPMTACSRRGLRFSRFGLAIMVSVLAIAATVASSHAAVTITPAPDFQVSITAGEAVSVGCSGGNVVVTIDGAPSATATPCNSVTSLSVSASGSFANAIDLHEVTSTDFTAIASVSIDGGAGDDTLIGSPLPDTIIGGDDNDTIDAGRGDDVVLGSGGDDVLTWNPGEGSDVFEGGPGIDTLVFNGSNASEHVTIDANGTRVRLFRDVATITMDIATTEQIALSTLGGTDNVTIADLGGVADLAAIHVSLGDADDTGDASGQVNPAVVVTFDGGPGNDTITGSPQTDIILGGDGDDTLDGRGGDDAIDGGNDNDTLVGGPGQDLVSGSAGDDTLIWNPGDGSDRLEGGPGTDTLLFNGSNVSESFTLGANGTRVVLLRDVGGVTMDVGGVETITLAALDGPNHVTVDDLTGVADLTGVTLLLGNSGDTVDAAAQADPAFGLTIQGGFGADRITGGAGADIIFGGRGDDVLVGSGGNDTFTWNPGDGNDTIEGGAGLDTLVFNGSNVSEHITFDANGPRLRMFRDVASIVMDLAGVETVTLDTLAGTDNVTVNDLTGVADLTSLAITLGDEDDVVDASAQLNPAVGMTIDGEAGDDDLTGGAGHDLIRGGRGNDVMRGSGGDDTFTWAPGDGSDTIDGGAGNDTLSFNGSNANEKIDVSRTPTGFFMTRDIASITMTVDAVETLDLLALGGDDQVSTVGLPSTTQSLDGGGQSAADVLTVDAQGAAVSSGSGTIAIAGSQPIQHVNFEEVDVLNAAVPAASLTATKSVTPPAHPGGIVTYTLVVTNTGTAEQEDNPGAELTDVLPAELQLVSATATGGVALATQQTNTATWNGALAPGASVTITIRAALKVGRAGGKTVSNQATLAFDADGDGSNESIGLSDDPALPGASDPTTFTVELPGNLKRGPSPT